MKPLLRFNHIQPTLFFIRCEGRLLQGVDLFLDGEGSGALELRVRGMGEELAFPLEAGAPSNQPRRVYLPDWRQEGPLGFDLVSGNALLDRTSLDWKPGRHWEVSLVHGSHHDLGYTDLPSSVLREQDGFLDEVLDLCDQTDHYPADSRFCYLAEQAWSVLHFVEHRPAAQVERLVRRLHEGRVEVTALFGNLTSELCGHEELIRALYPAFRLKRRYGVPLSSAELNDIPGLSWGLASVLAGAGVRYFAPGIPDYFAWGFKTRPYWDEAAVLPRDLRGAFWWQGADDQRVLLWYEGGMIGLACDQIEDGLQAQLEDLETRRYPHRRVRFKVISGQRDNSPPSLRVSEFARRWNEIWAYPHLEVSTNARFFAGFEAECGSGLPVLRGELPNTDYTLGAASTARDTGINRRAKATLAAAETFTAAAGLHGGPVQVEALAEAWENALLYDEHTWGMAHPAGAAQAVCAAQKGLFAARAAALAEDTLVKSANFLADRVALPEEGYHLVVFNPLDRLLTTCVRAPVAPVSPCSLLMYWKQSSGTPILAHGNALDRDVLSLPDEIVEAPFNLVDLETGENVPYQIVRLSDPNHPSPYAAQRYSLAHTDPTSQATLNYTRGQAVELAFIARDLPACGYKTYAIRPGAKAKPLAPEIACGDHWLESRFYRLELDPISGAVTRLFDKQLQREWVDAGAAHGVNQLVARWPATGEVRAAGQSTVRVGERGPVYASLVVEGSAPGCPQRIQEIILYAGLKRVDFNNRLLRDATPLLELLFAFPFALQNPRFCYEAANAQIEPLRDQLPGSNTAAYTVQDWVNVQDPAGMLHWNTLEAPVVSLGGLWPSPISQAHHGATPPGFAAEFLRDPAQLSRGHIYSYAAVSSFRTNFQPVQPGEMLFRYRLTTLPAGPTAPSAAGANGMINAEPFCAWLRGPQPGELGVSGSFCQVEGQGVILQALKIADDGDGLVLRLREITGRQARARVLLPGRKIEQAWLTNLVEENQRELPCGAHAVQVDLTPYALATIRLRAGRRWPATTRMFFE